ncbi:MAG TPA: hypothetical protein VNR37_03430 [Microbacteriaceae bacterium]|nr:hypothetical protein [Microbacteriaceae bacterium]
MSKLAERIAQAQPKPRLRLDDWFAGLDAEDRAAVQNVALDPAWTNVMLVSFLAGEGLEIGKDAVAAWRARLGFRR